MDAVVNITALRQENVQTRKYNNYAYTKQQSEFSHQFNTYLFCKMRESFDWLIQYDSK